METDHLICGLENEAEKSIYLVFSTIIRNMYNVRYFNTNI